MTTIEPGDASTQAGMLVRTTPSSLERKGVVCLPLLTDGMRRGFTADVQRILASSGEAALYAPARLHPLSGAL